MMDADNHTKKSELAQADRCGDQSCSCVAGSVVCLDDDKPRKNKVGLGFGGFLDSFWNAPDLKIVLVGLALLVISLFAERIGITQPWVMIVQLLILPLAGWTVFRDGFATLIKNQRFNMNTLMSVAAIGAVVLGETYEAIILLLLFTASEALEDYINDNAREILREFADLAPKTAIRLQPEGEIEVSVQALNPGDTIIVRPADRIPMDGVILRGSSSVNQAPITGESKLIEKTVGEEVLSGSINGQGVLQVEVTSYAQDNTIQRIINLVTEAQQNKAEQVKFIDRFAAIYTPIVFVIALLVVIIPVFVFNQPFWNVGSSYGWLHRSLSLLMIGCPCALVISTPITMISGLTRAAKAGVIFKGGVFLEGLSNAGAIAFDKTGTLTKGEPVVSQVKAVDCLSDGFCTRCDDLVAYTSALEVHSSHPLASSVIDEANRRGIASRYPPAEDLKVLEGKGQTGYVNGKLGTVGSLSLFLSEHQTPEELVSAVREAEEQGKSTMLVCDGEMVRGFLSVEDALRPGMEQVIRDVRSAGLHPVILTGDNPTVAEKVAKQVGIDEVHSALLPEEKLAWLTRLKAKYGNVVMAGDGINDSPALARADIGIAMGGAGNAQVLETADVVLLNDDLEKLPFAIRLSKFVNKLVRQNVIISLGVKALVAVFAVMGLTPLWVAVLADIGISLIVTLNGTRALRFEPQAQLSEA
ncbi:MAG: heavy metal translocating P-type ATPase [Anaerolineaceae bacterium]|nr:heavy metal translocating P-type ATPase [Anaerolineaceae bacterium]